MIAYETFDSMQRSNESRILCYLDMEKAHDNINWSFLLGNFQRYEIWGNIDFLDRVVHNNGKFTVVNGSSSSFFHSSKGLREGDPLSPYLVIAAMDAFTSLIKSAIAGKYLCGWRMGGAGREGLLILRLLFAYDIFFVCEAIENHHLFDLVTYMLCGLIGVYSEFG